ncbi:MAG: hypothetical protein ACTSWQ_00830 [Candidatus Thorarchaeota archaeon]
MELRELEKAYKIMTRRYESMIEANDALTNANHQLVTKIQLMERQLIERDQKLLINNQIMQDAIMNQNQMKEDMAGEIAILRKKIKDLEGGS